MRAAPPPPPTKFSLPPVGVHDSNPSDKLKIVLLPLKVTGIAPHPTLPETYSLTFSDKNAAVKFGNDFGLTKFGDKAITRRTVQDRTGKWTLDLKSEELKFILASMGTTTPGSSLRSQAQNLTTGHHHPERALPSGTATDKTSLPPITPRHLPSNQSPSHRFAPRLTSPPAIAVRSDPENAIYGSVTQLDLETSLPTSLTRAYRDIRSRPAPPSPNTTTTTTLGVRRAPQSPELKQQTPQTNDETSIVLPPIKITETKTGGDDATETSEITSQPKRNHATRPPPIDTASGRARNTGTVTATNGTRTGATIFGKHSEQPKPNLVRSIPQTEEPPEKTPPVTRTSNSFLDKSPPAGSRQRGPQLNSPADPTVTKIAPNSHVANIISMQQKTKDIALDDLKPDDKGDQVKKSHWRWYQFPCPLMRHPLSPDPSPKTIEFSFRNFQDVLDFIDAPGAMATFLEVAKESSKANLGTDEFYLSRALLSFQSVLTILCKTIRRTEPYQTYRKTLNSLIETQKHKIHPPYSTTLPNTFQNQEAIVTSWLKAYNPHKEEAFA